MPSLTSQSEGQDKSWQALAEALAALSESLDPQQVLETALEQSAALLSDQSGLPEQLVQAVLFLSEDPAQARSLRVIAMRGLSQAECAVELAASGGLIGQAVRKGEARLSQEIRADPELIQLASLRACQEVYCIPLGGPSPEGVILFGHPEAGFFSSERCRFLDLLARQTWLAFVNARRFRESQLRLERLSDLSDLNRSELAQELHDGPIQSVAALAMRVNIARRIAVREASSLADELAKIEAVARQATGELRQLLFRIHPQLLESQGLAAALLALGEKTSQLHGKRVHVQVEPDIGTGLNMNKQMAIFDLADQALREASKKEEVGNIWLRLTTGSQGQAVLEIEDDGRVVTVSGAKPSGALQDQVALLEGILESKSRGTHGSCLIISIPLDSLAPRSKPGEA